MSRRSMLAASAWLAVCPCLATATTAAAEPAHQSDAQYRVRIDVAPQYRFRARATGPAKLFDGPPLVTGWLRGTIWHGKQYSRCMGECWRFGYGFTYGYEAGRAKPVLAGVESWMTGHDLTPSLVLERAARLASDDDDAWFLRVVGGAGLSLTTLQLRSTADRHVYSQTTASANVNALLEIGARINGWLDVFMGGGGFWAAPRSKLRFAHAELDLESRSSSIDGISRNAVVVYYGAGLEF